VPADSALLVTAPSGDPFADADLFRTARLVRQYGRHRMVEVALIGGDPDPAEGVRRCRALGARDVALLPAAWVRPPLPETDHLVWGGPLLSAAAVAAVLRARAREARERFARYGDDGVARGIEAAHGHGYAHGHGPKGHGHHSHGPAPHGEARSQHAQDADGAAHPEEVPRTAEEFSRPAPLVLPYDLPVHRSLR
jgi:hypothetical protein